MGGAILLGLVTLMVVVASVRGTMVSGRPVATPVPDPPEPGHCLLEDPFDDDLFGYVLSDDGKLPAWRTGPCSGARYGKVVTIGAGSTWRPPSRTGPGIGVGRTPTGTLGCRIRCPETTTGSRTSTC